MPEITTPQTTETAPAPAQTTPPPPGNTLLNPPPTHR